MSPKDADFSPWLAVISAHYESSYFVWPQQPHRCANIQLLLCSMVTYAWHATTSVCSRTNVSHPWLGYAHGLHCQITAIDLSLGQSVKEVSSVIQVAQTTLTLSAYFPISWWVPDHAEEMWSGKDKHREVCPANWKEGGIANHMDGTAMLEYFAAFYSSQESATVNGTKHTSLQAVLEHNWIFAHFPWNIWRSKESSCYPDRNLSAYPLTSLSNKFKFLVFLNSALN
jgi:hypothetical protein